MVVFRLGREKYKNDLSGYGSSINGQRWNSKGTAVVYTAQNRALAFSEMAVHVPLGILPRDYHMIEIEIPERLNIMTLEASDLPAGWNAIPSQPASQQIGDAFVQQNKFPVLRVPSVVISGEYNFVLNPKHQDFQYIKILRTEPFPFDSRMFYRP